MSLHQEFAPLAACIFPKEYGGEVDGKPDYFKELIMWDEMSRA